MSDEQRMELIKAMGLNIAHIDSAIKESDGASASAAYVEFMGAAGLLAMEIDELNHANSN
jgi:hypothetical protein